jgi:hypothetical protein
LEQATSLSAKFDYFQAEKSKITSTVNSLTMQQKTIAQVNVLATDQKQCIPNNPYFNNNNNSPYLDKMIYAEANTYTNVSPGIYTTTSPNSPHIYRPNYNPNLPPVSNVPFRPPYNAPNPYPQQNNYPAYYANNQNNLAGMYMPPQQYPPH